MKITVSLVSQWAQIEYQNQSEPKRIKNFKFWWLMYTFGEVLLMYLSAE